MVWTRSLCRTCGQLGDACYPIFDPTDSRNIELKMQKCLTIPLNRDDNKPKEICNCCYMKLNEFHDFVEMCHASYSRFETMIYSSNDQELWLEKQTQECLDGLTGVIVNAKNAEAQIPAGNSVVILDYDNLDLTDGFHCLKESESSKATDNYKNYSCCEQNQTVLRHSSDFYKTINGSNSDAFVSIEQNIVYKEKYCDEKPQDDKKPQSTVIRRKFTCQHCQKSFTRKNSLNTHISTHSKSKPFTCNICFKTFGTKRHLKFHEILHTNKYECDICSKNFHVPSKLQRHLRTHTKQRHFVCSVQNCAKAFVDSSNLRGHMLTHTDVKAFLCEICNKTYRTSSQLNHHRKGHTDYSAFACDICGKKYKWKSNLVSHSKKHNK